MRRISLMVTGILLWTVTSAQPLRDTLTLSRIPGGMEKINAAGNIPYKYFQTLSKKVEKYDAQVLSKMEKTLTRLSKWEDKIRKSLEKINPGAAARLFEHAG